jgi:hypothetical protein
LFIFCVIRCIQKKDDNIEEEAAFDSIDEINERLNIIEYHHTNKNNLTNDSINED